MCETSEPPFAGKREMVESEREDLPVSRACELMEVNRSGLYKARQPRRDRDEEVRALMDPIIEYFAGYGYRRVAKELVNQGFVVNHKRVLRIMRQNGWLCRLRSGRIHSRAGLSRPAAITTGARTGNGVT